jgi:fatty acid amide hydrolase 2
VNEFLNAVVEDRFDDALEEAKRADKLAAEQSVVSLTQNYPLLGIPFTVKESCGLAGMSFTGCSKPRIGITAVKDGEAVGRLRAAGCIPLCVVSNFKIQIKLQAIN